MKGFVNQLLNSLKYDEKLSKDPLVKMLIESTDKSILLGEHPVAIYNKLKEGVNAIAKKTKIPQLQAICEQFVKHESTPETKVHAIAKEISLSERIKDVKSSVLGKNPVIVAQLDLFEGHLLQGTPDYMLCEAFVKLLAPHQYDKVALKHMRVVKKYLNENQSKHLILNSIYSMDSMANEQYRNVSSDLKRMLLNESYTSDILKIKYGTTIPIVNQLVNDLRLLESKKQGFFTLGEGDSFTAISNMIAPATKAKDGFIVYTNDRFVSIRESKSLTGKETKIYFNGKVKIAEVDPNYVKSKFPRFYKVSEAFATLGFRKNIDGTGVESNSIRNFNLKLAVNENNGIDLYLNGNLVKDATQVSLNEAISLETAQTKQRLVNLLENTENLFNFDFIKEVTNERTMAEAKVLKINNDFYICEKLNAAEYEWNKVDEYQMYEFFAHKFNYDISPIFKTKIDEKVEKYQHIEKKKKEILGDVSKLEVTLDKLRTAIHNPDTEPDAVKKLEKIKESIESTMNALRQDYVGLDLIKKGISYTGGSTKIKPFIKESEQASPYVDLSSCSDSIKISVVDSKGADLFKEAEFSENEILIHLRDDGSYTIGETLKVTVDFQNCGNISFTNTITPIGGATASYTDSNKSLSFEYTISQNTANDKKAGANLGAPSSKIGNYVIQIKLPTNLTTNVAASSAIAKTVFTPTAGAAAAPASTDSNADGVQSAIDTIANLYPGSPLNIFRST